MFTELPVLSAVLYCSTQPFVQRAVPCILQRDIVQVTEIRHFKVIAATDTQLAVGRDPHIGKWHQAGFFDNLAGRLFVRCAACTVGQDFFQIAHLNQDINILEFIRMRIDIIVDLLNVVMQLHVQTVVIDNQLVDIRNDRFYLIDVQDQSVRGHKDKAVRQLFSCVFVELYDSGIQPGLIVSVQGQMSLVVPVP